MVLQQDKGGISQKGIPFLYQVIDTQIELSTSSPFYRLSFLISPELERKLDQDSLSLNSERSPIMSFSSRAWPPSQGLVNTKQQHFMDSSR
ncbi:hypothetical protein RRG08_039865 [Elysia crispata]|uniref:Uncharacterized protein n=1 Tax=Elysia crispata TaxID=231223 RepID=A0AAE0ZWN8_9GAST|nr:hypothetical protein RRG08_039865 [Elysia crispata]